MGWFWDGLGVGTENPPLFGSCPSKCFLVAQVHTQELKRLRQAQDEL